MSLRDRSVRGVSIVGTDTSHAAAFAELIQGMPDLRLRVRSFWPGPVARDDRARSVQGDVIARLRGLGIPAAHRLDDVVSGSEGVLLELQDARDRLPIYPAIFAAGVPVFVDKPLGRTLDDVRGAIGGFRDAGTPWFAASALRYSPQLVRAHERAGPVRSMTVRAPLVVHEAHSDLFWYGIHAAEALLAVLGSQVATVSARQTNGLLHVHGTWSTGVSGHLVGVRHKDVPFRLRLLGDRRITIPDLFASGYAPLLGAISRFFHSGTSPVPPHEVFAGYALCSAASESARSDGEQRPVRTLSGPLTTSDPGVP